MSSHLIRLMLITALISKIPRSLAAGQTGDVGLPHNFTITKPLQDLTCINHLCVSTKRGKAKANQAIIGFCTVSQVHTTAMVICSNS